MSIINVILKLVNKLDDKDIGNFVLADYISQYLHKDAPTDKSEFYAVILSSTDNLGRIIESSSNSSFSLSVGQLSLNPKIVSDGRMFLSENILSLSVVPSSQDLRSPLYSLLSYINSDYIGVLRPSRARIISNGVFVDAGRDRSKTFVIGNQNITARLYPLFLQGNENALPIELSEPRHIILNYIELAIKKYENDHRRCALLKEAKRYEVNSTTRNAVEEVISNNLRRLYADFPGRKLIKRLPTLEDAVLKSRKMRIGFYKSQV